MPNSFFIVGAKVLIYSHFAKRAWGKERETIVAIRSQPTREGERGKRNKGEKDAAMRSQPKREGEREKRNKGEKDAAMRTQPTREGVFLKNNVEKKGGKKFG
jgi:hypothetical protein